MLIPVQATAREKIEGCKQILYEAREKRPHPFLDDKIITAWNALMISAFARASRVLDDLQCESLLSIDYIP